MLIKLLSNKLKFNKKQLPFEVLKCAHAIQDIEDKVYLHFVLKLYVNNKSIAFTVSSFLTKFQYGVCVGI